MIYFFLVPFIGGVLMVALILKIYKKSIFFLNDKDDDDE